MAGCIAGWIMGALAVGLWGIIQGIVQGDIVWMPQWGKILAGVYELPIGQILELFVLGMNGTVIEKISTPFACLFLLVLVLALIGLHVCAIIWLINGIKKTSPIKLIVSGVCGIISVVYHQQIGVVLMITLGVFIFMAMVMGAEVSGFGYEKDGVFWFWNYKKKD